MFNIGPLELIVILLVALLVVGPKRLPEMSRTIGKSLRELRRTTEDMRRSIEFDIEDDADDEPSAPPLEEPPPGPEPPQPQPPDRPVPTTPSEEPPRTGSAAE
jgi:Tat protein translocase TatB subunit